MLFHRAGWNGMSYGNNTAPNKLVILVWLLFFLPFQASIDFHSFLYNRKIY